MNGSQQNRPYLLVFTVFTGAVLLLGIFFLIYPRLNQATDQPVESVTTIVPVIHQFRKGVHTYVGDIQVPTPCFIVTGQAVVKESYPEQVDLRIETRATGETCAQVITLKKFKVSFEASEGAIIKTYLNTLPVLFQVKEAPVDTDLQSIQI